MSRIASFPNTTSRSRVARRLAFGWWLLTSACQHHEPSDHGHEHENHGAKEEVAPVAITRWTARYELFVEFPSPMANAKLAYHAHVTRLSDFQAVTDGKFTVRFKHDGQVVAEASADKAKRAGIFTPEGQAPSRGRYKLEMNYEQGGKTDTFDCGTLEVSDKPTTTEEAPVVGEIAFLKETQWKIPFGTAWAEERELSGTVEFPSIVETAGSDQLTLGAPTSGRFFHGRSEALAIGRRVQKGEVLGTIAPNVEGEDFTRLQSSVEVARLQQQQIQAEIQRVTPLIEQGLVAAHRMIELKNELVVQRAKLSAAERRVGSVVAPGGAGGLPIRATIAGVLREVLVPNGEPVEAGAVLLRLAGTHHVWIRSRFVARPLGELENAEPIAARLGDGRRIDLRGRARFMSPDPIVDPSTRLATWVIDVAPGTAPEKNADLLPGAAIVLAVRAGVARKVVAVPRQAVVEISTRPYVFVQANGESFFKRRVEIGASDGDWVEIRSGVRPGERVVTEGGYDVHIASLAGTVESHRH